MTITSGILNSAKIFLEILVSSEGKATLGFKHDLVPGISSAQTIHFLVSISIISIEGNIISLNTDLFSESTYQKDLSKFLLKLYYENLDKPYPFWLKVAQYGRKQLLNRLSDDLEDKDIKSCLKQADLLSELDDIGINWWQDLKEFSRNISNNTKIKIGRKGENLSMAYEKKRGINKPELKSIEDDSLGYDILSYTNPGNRDGGPRLFIEVKTSEQSIDRSEASITRNEWNVAKSQDNYIFHLWDISNEEKPKLALIKKDEMQKHESIDQGKGKYSGFNVPFIEFKEKFQIQDFN